MVQAALDAPGVRKSARAHDAVLASAAEVVGRRGYAGASIEAIALEAGVAKQTIYRWWPNKAALFIDVYGRIVPRDLVAKDTGSIAGDLDALLSQLSVLYAHTAAGKILSGLIADAQADAAVAAQLRDTYVAPRRAIVRSILRRAVQRGEIDAPDDPDFASDLLSGAIWFRLLLGERRLDRAFRRRLVAGMLRSVARPA